MKITKIQYSLLDKLQHLWKEINQANAHIKLTATIDDGDNTEIIFCQLPDFTKALIDAEQNKDSSLLEII